MEPRFDSSALLFDLLKEPLGLRNLEPGIDSRRLTGTTDKDEYVSIIVKPVGPNHAGTFKHWVTLSPAEAEGLTEGPRGWKGYVAMIGLLDNGQPWWAGVYSRDNLRETAHAAQKVERGLSGGWFWRWDPGLLKPVVFKDYTEPESEVSPEDLPPRVVVGNDGAYWRAYDEGYSMPPVNPDNSPVIPVAIYERVK